MGFNDQFNNQGTEKHRLGYLVPVFLILGVLMWIGWVIWLRDVPEDVTGTFQTIIFFVKEERVVEHVSIPDEVRGLYWTGNTAGSEHGQELLDYMIDSGLNTVVIDLKTDNGELVFSTDNESLREYVIDYPVIEDLDGLLFQLEELGIYRIARIPVMRDGAFALVNPEVALKTDTGEFWQDNIGSVWVDPAAREVWDYAVALGLEAYARGFDEVQYDYVRFASDGEINSIVYPVYNGATSKVAIMQKFFETIGGAVRDNGVPVSFDLFGMTFWSTDDFNIGQCLIDVYQHADYVSPMVYPSHYPDGFKGYENPAMFPYEIVKRSLDEGAAMLEREALISPEESRQHFRPWLQDFDLGAVYTSDFIEAQIQAARDAGASGWILWNARNVYEPAEYVERRM